MNQTMLRCFLLLYFFSLTPLSAGAKPPKDSTRKRNTLSKAGLQQIQKVRTALLRSAKRMPCLGYVMDDSYCHIGAAYSAAWVLAQGVDIQLFQPTPYHMLSRFKVEGQWVYVDQFMGQFFTKGSKAHKILTGQGGFVGTKADFVRFWRKHINDAQEWGSYGKGGFLSRKSTPQYNGRVRYEDFVKGVDWKQVNSRETRLHRVLTSWYGDFLTDTTYDQATGLFWTARYFLRHFQFNLPSPTAGKCPL